MPGALTPSLFIIPSPWMETNSLAAKVIYVTNCQYGSLICNESFPPFGSLLVSSTLINSHATRVASDGWYHYVKLGLFRTTLIILELYLFWMCKVSTVALDDPTPLSMSDLSTCEKNIDWLHFPFFYHLVEKWLLLCMNGPLCFPLFLYVYIFLSPLLFDIRIEYYYYRSNRNWALCLYNHNTIQWIPHIWRWDMLKRTPYVDRWEMKICVCIENSRFGVQYVNDAPL